MEGNATKDNPRGAGGLFGLDTLQLSSRRHAASGANANNSLLFAPPAQLHQCGPKVTYPRHPIGLAERNSPAIDVGGLPRRLQLGLVVERRLRIGFV